MPDLGPIHTKRQRHHAQNHGFTIVIFKVVLDLMLENGFQTPSQTPKLILTLTQTIGVDTSLLELKPLMINTICNKFLVGGKTGYIKVTSRIAVFWPATTVS